jgi:predicted nucleic-acid-binding Zn-ribbon protein
MNDKICPKCGSAEFAEGTDFMPIKPLNKKLSMTGSNKIFTFCLSCGEVVSIRIENLSLFKK